MTLHTVQIDDVPPQAWRNGGGTTRELLRWPSTIDCALRVSVADVTRDGPFSSFPGIERWFAVIEGEGVALTFGDTERRVGAGDLPLSFDGAAAPACRLLGEPTRDLNLMLRGGRGLMQAVSPGIAWDAIFQLRGLFTAGAGRWSCGNDERTLRPNTLLWTEGLATAAWTFEPHEPHTRAWWLGFTPAGTP
jgi:environmental stress-induced protein Ves